MKKTITTTLLVFGLSAGLPSTQLLVAAETEPEITQEDTEQGLKNALKTQVALAKAKVSLLQARTEFWLEKNSDKAQKSLDKARINLDEGWQSANEVTRARITQLRLQIDKASTLLQEKSQKAETELLTIADRSESALNAALTQVQTRSTELKDEVATRYALSQAKASALRARIALEIDNSPETAKQALQDAREYLQQAKSGASEATAEKLSQLQAKAQDAQKAVSEKASDAKMRVNDLVESTEKHLQSYGKNIQKSEEVTLLKKRYGQLEAKVALMKANLAEKSDASKKQVIAYLDESRAWYDSLKSQASQRWHKELTDMSARIDETKQAVERKEKQARTKLADLLERAAAMIKDEDSAE